MSYHPAGTGDRILIEVLPDHQQIFPQECILKIALKIRTGIFPAYLR